MADITALTCTTPGEAPGPTDSWVTSGPKACERVSALPLPAALIACNRAGRWEVHTCSRSVHVGAEVLPMLSVKAGASNWPVQAR